MYYDESPPVQWLLPWKFVTLHLSDVSLFDFPMLCATLDVMKPPRTQQQLARPTNGAAGFVFASQGFEFNSSRRGDPGSRSSKRGGRPHSNIFPKINTNVRTKRQNNCR